MTLFQRFMRVLTHPQHAGQPLPERKPNRSTPARSAKSAKAPPAARPAPTPTKAAPKPQTVGTSVAEKPAGGPVMPGAPRKPVEVFSPDRIDAAPSKAHGDPVHANGDGKHDVLGRDALLSGVDGLDAMGDADDSSMALSNNGQADRTTAIEKPAEPAEPQGPQIGDVVDLIEKLRTHVDAQNGRFEQAMGVLDQIKTSAAALPEIKARIDTMLASIDELKANQFQGHQKVERALTAQSSRLDEIARAIERATQREERLAQSLVEINQTILAVSTTNDRLAGAIDGMRRHEAERDARLGRALTGAQRWLIVLTLVMAVGMAATIITAVVVGG